MIITFDFLLRVFTLLLFVLWVLYWQITEKEADRSKPKREEKFIMRQQVRRWILRIAEGTMLLQVIGLQFLPFSTYLFLVQVLGFIFVLIGVIIAVSARKTLGVNWAHAYQYQIKKEQELVTTGVYSLIRHPIYSGLCLAYIGGELVAQSYLVLIGILFLMGGYWQARQEEAILIEHFGKDYTNYLKRTKMFIPYLW